VKLVHPEIEAYAEASEDQYQMVYAPRGWQKMDEPSSFANDLLGRFVRSTEDLTLDEARALLASRPGAEYPDEKASKEAVYAAYTDSFGDRSLTPTPPTETAAGIPIKAFDPSEHTVDEVHAHLARSDEAEQMRVLEAEESNKGRVTITNWSPPASDESAPGGEEE
jgi:hypothetical protein